MSNMENTYWNDNGKYQAFVNALEERIPSIGYTTNVYANLFIAMSHLYYDAYNNGGCNIEDCYMRDYRQHIEPYLGSQVDPQTFIDGNVPKIEAMMDLAIAYICEKDLDFPVYTFWINHMKRAISTVSPPEGFDEKSEWLKISFGDKDDLMICYRGYVDISYTVRSPEEQKEAATLDCVIKHCEAAGRQQKESGGRDRVEYATDREER